MARRKSCFCHFFYLRCIPCTYDKSSTVRIALYFSQYPVDLIKSIEISPLFAVYGAKFSSGSSKCFVMFYGFDKLIHFFFPFRSIFWKCIREIIFGKIVLEWSFVSYIDVILYKITYICISCKKPKQLISNCIEVDFFGRKERKSLLEIDMHLIAKTTSRSHTSPV